MQIADAAPLAQQNLHTLKRSFRVSQIDDLEMPLVRESLYSAPAKLSMSCQSHQMSRESFQSTSHSQSNPRNTDLDATREDSAALGSSRPSILRTTLRLPSAPTIHPASIVSEVSPRATVASTPLPFFDEKEVKLSRVLTGRGTGYCGNPVHHEYELYFAVEDIDHSRTETKSPQTNGIAERFHKTVLDEFYRIAFRKRLYASIEDLQDGLDLWVKSYNKERPHQGRRCFGKTPLQTCLDAIPVAREK
jgi:Integrase core domain